MVLLVLAVTEEEEGILSRDMDTHSSSSNSSLGMVVMEGEEAGRAGSLV